MITNTFSFMTTGWVAVAAGIAGLLGLAFIALFFTVGQPFGTLNDIFIGLTAILSMVLAWKLYPWHHTQSLILSQVGLVLALIGGVVVLTGSVFAIFRISGWYLAGLYMAAGNGLIGLWLLALCYSALDANIFPRSLVILGLISGVILMLGLVAIPGIFRGLDLKDYTMTAFNAVWWTASLGYLALYPAWSVLIGRSLLGK